MNSRHELGPAASAQDTTLAKMFPIKERMKFELRMEAYNLSAQKPGAFGRQAQYTGRII